MIESYIDRINADQVKEMGILTSRFVYHTGISFRVVDSNAFHEMIKRLRPAYYNTGKLPSSKLIGTTYLLAEYNRMKEIGDLHLQTATCYSITSDGCSKPTQSTL
jgi:hypothetical protein